MNPAVQAQITMFGFGQIILFLVFMGVAAIINKAKKRMVLNGALCYLVAGTLLLSVSLARLLSNPAIAPGLKSELAGNILGTMLLPLGAAIYYAIRFRKQKTAGANAPVVAPSTQRKTPSL